MRCAHWPVCMKYYYEREDKFVKTPEEFDKLNKEFVILIYLNIQE